MRATPPTRPLELRYRSRQIDCDSGLCAVCYPLATGERAAAALFTTLPGLKTAQETFMEAMRYRAMSPSVLTALSAF